MEYAYRVDNNAEDMVIVRMADYVIGKVKNVESRKLVRYLNIVAARTSIAIQIKNAVISAEECLIAGLRNTVREELENVR